MVWRCVGAQLRHGVAVAASCIGNSTAERARDRSPLYGVLHLQPNEWMTPFSSSSSRRCISCCAACSIARILDDQRFGRIQQLVPMNPDRVTPELLPTGRLRFTIAGSTARTSTLTQNQVHYRTGLTLDGVKGVGDRGGAPTSARDGDGDTRAADFFNNGAVPPVALRIRSRSALTDRRTCASRSRSTAAGTSTSSSKRRWRRPPRRERARCAAARGAAVQRRRNRRHLRGARASRRHHEARRSAMPRSKMFDSRT
jgi:hypothetical protein